MTQPRLLGGRYQIGDTLGYGGMAEVHHGRDVRLGREVAIKVLRADLARDPSFQARFRREAQAAASLNHPSIVSVYDTGEDNADGGNPAANGHPPYIVMEYVDGRTLRDVLKAEGRLHPQRAMEIAADICSALDFSHRAGIVHRDIKPGNVMITQAGVIKVMDFGIARAIADNAATVTSTAAVIGTAQYLSPEQARGEPVDARSDVYSLGCLLYELLTGGPPFTGDSPVAVAYQHVREDANPPSRTNRDVPPQVDAIVMKALAKNPVNRYQTAGEMRTDLVRAMTGRPVLAEPVMSEEERTIVLGPVGDGNAAQPGLGGYELVSEERGSRRMMAFVLLGLAVVAVFVLAALLTMKLLQPPPAATKVTVPNLLGKTRAQATALLTQAGLTVGTVTTRETNKAAEVGTVLETDPQRGEQVDPSSAIKLVIGKAPGMVTVPPVRNLTYGEAAQRIISARLTPVRLGVDDAATAGTVLGTDPAEGSQVPPNTRVTVRVSTGRMTLPRDLIGKNGEQMAAWLRARGFTNVVIATAPPTNGDYAAGIIWKTLPDGGQPVAKTDQIILYVAPPTSAPPTSVEPTVPSLTPTPTPTPTPTATDTPTATP
ncbi:MAG TPA: Stk1 family PASTA domain-containing Ser/Thr kinase [Mycobacteriales bacterium]|nr:Stk1 family PASTA domain-containing Ser/Thr kinase [Mycobacteriales bacterium]